MASSDDAPMVLHNDENPEIGVMYGSRYLDGTVARWETRRSLLSRPPPAFQRLDRMKLCAHCLLMCLQCMATDLFVGHESDTALAPSIEELAWVAHK